MRRDDLEVRMTAVALEREPQVAELAPAVRVDASAVVSEVRRAVAHAEVDVAREDDRASDLRAQTRDEDEVGERVHREGDLVTLRRRRVIFGRDARVRDENVDRPRFERGDG